MKRLVALTALLMLIPAVAARADDQTVRVATLPIDPTAAVYYADELGYFKAAGINVDITTFTNGGASGAALVGGAVDVGLIDLVSMASAHSHGVPLVYLAPAAVYTNDAQTYFIIVPQSSPIKTAKDFAGKIVAVNGIKNVNQIPTQAWIDNNGGDSSKVKFIELTFPAMVPALEDGHIDAAAVTEPTLALTNGKYRVISLAAHNVAPTFMVSGFAANPAWIKAHPDLAAKFAAALMKANAWANTHHTESAAILAKVSKLSPDVAARMVRVYYGEHLDRAQLQPVIDATAKYGVIPKPFPAAEIMSTDGK